MTGNEFGRGAWRFRQLILLTIASAGGIYARTELGPVQEAIRLGLSLSDTQIALLQGPAVALPLVLTSIPIGIAIDRYSRAKLLIGLMVVNIVGCVLTAISPNFTALLMARCLIGVAGTAPWLTSISMLADLYSDQHRGRATMAVTFGGVAGMSLAFAIGGQLLSKFPGNDGWRSAILCMTVPLILVTLMLFKINEPARHEAEGPALPLVATLTQLLAHRGSFVPLLLGLAMIVVADGASTIWAAPVFFRRFALSAQSVGAIMSAVLLASGVLGPIFGGFLADACERLGGPRRTAHALAVSSLAAVVSGLFAIGPGTLSVTLLLVVFMTIGAAFNVVVPSLLTLVVPSNLRGLCLSICSATCMVSAFGVAPLAVSVLSEYLGGGSMIASALATICVMSSLMGAASFAIGARTYRFSAGR